MSSAVAQEMIIAVEVQMQQAMKQIAALRKEMQGISMPKDVDKSFKALQNSMASVTRYYSAMGNSSGAVAEKMSLVKREIRSLTDSGFTKNDEAVKRLINTYESLAKSGSKVSQMGRIADTLTGGKVSQTSELLSSMGVNMGKLGTAGAVAAGAVVALGVAWKAVIGPGIAFNAMLEQQETAFKVMLGSAYKASVMMQDLKDLSMTTPIGFAEGAVSAKQLIAYGFAQSEIITNMKMLATVASATGTSVGDLTYVYGTLRAQGQAYTRDLMQFGMRGIPIFEYLAKVLETDVKGVRKLTEEGKVGFAEVQKALEMMTSEGGKFDGLLEESMKTLTGLQTIMKNSFQMGIAEAVKPLVPLVKAITKSLTSGFMSLKPVIETIMNAIAGIGIVLQPIIDAINIILGIFGLVFAIINMIVRVISKIEIAGKSIGSIFLSWMSPLSKVASWIANIVAGIDKIARSASDIGEATFIDIGELAKIEIKNTKIKEYMAGELAAGIKEGVMVFPQVVTKSVPWGELTKMEQSAIEAGWKTAFGGAETAADIKKYTDKMKKETSFEVTRKEDVVRWDLWKPSPDFVQSVQKTLNDLNDTAAYNWDETVSVIMASLPEEARKLIKITDDEMASLLKSGETLSVHYWDAFVRNGPAGAIPMLTDAVKQYGGEAAKTYVTQWDSAIEDVITKGKRLGDSQEEITAAVSDAAKQGFDSLNKSLDILYSMEPKYLNDEQFKVFLKKLEEARNRYKDLIKEGGTKDKTKEEKAILIDMMSYMKSRADWMNKETDELYKQVALYTGIKDIGKSSLDVLTRALAINEYQYKLDKEALAKKYEGHQELKTEYDIELAIAKIKWEQADAQTKLLEGQRLYNKALKGAPDYWTNVQSQIGTALQGAPKRDNNGNIIGYEAPGMSEYMQAGAGSMELGMQGTDSGSVIAGADPIMMLITGLVEVVASMEEFSQTLNFVSIIGKGFSAALQVADKAFRPLNTVLMMIGEMLGAFFGPTLEMVGTFLSDVAQVVAPLINILMQFFNAVMPLVVLFFKLANPIMILFEFLADMMGMSEEELELRRQQIEDMKELYDKQVKSLQDLYNVGAISGDEYERRLAELKAGMEAPAGGEDSGPMAELNASVNELVRLVEELIYPIIKWVADIIAPILVATFDSIEWLLSTLVPVMNLVNVVLTLVKGAVDLLWGWIVALFTGDWVKFDAIATAVGESIKTAWDAFWLSIKQWFADFVNIFIKALNAIPGVSIKPIVVIDPSDPLANISTGKQTYGYAVGTPNVPSDMMAQIHKGEMIVPATFADAIRKGEVSLGGGGASGSTIVYNINVGGTVITERDFYRTVGSELTKLGRQGQL